MFGRPFLLQPGRGLRPDQLEQRLNDVGVYHFWQIADLDPEIVETLDRTLKLKGRIARDGWVAAAKQLTESQAA